MRATKALIFDVDRHAEPSGLVSTLSRLCRAATPTAVVGEIESIERLGKATDGCHVLALSHDGGLTRLESYTVATRDLAVDPSHTAVVSASTAALTAARSGGFGLVVGLETASPDSLNAAGADVVVSSVGSLPVDVSRWIDLLPGPKSALESIEQIRARLGERPAIFLDYDGTMTPIVDDPAKAVIGDSERATLRRLSERLPVAIISGRGLDDVQSLVSVEGLFYAGSHGFEIENPDGHRFEHDSAREALPDLDEAQRLLDQGTRDLEGVVIERKRFAIAVHTRRASTQAVRVRAGEVARDVAARFEGLALTGGKEIHELRPAVPWDKGSALLYVLDFLSDDLHPMYVGDDETDEDAFLAVRRQEQGVGILVGSTTPTWADYSLDSPAQTMTFLDGLISRLE